MRLFVFMDNGETLRFLEPVNSSLFHVMLRVLTYTAQCRLNSVNYSKRVLAASVLFGPAGVNSKMRVQFGSARSGAAGKSSSTRTTRTTCKSQKASVMRQKAQAAEFSDEDAGTDAAAAAAGGGCNS